MATFAEPAPIESDVRNDGLQQDHTDDHARPNGTQLNGTSSHSQNAINELSSAPSDLPSDFAPSMNGVGQSVPIPSLKNSATMETESQPAPPASETLKAPQTQQPSLDPAPTSAATPTPAPEQPAEAPAPTLDSREEAMGTPALETSVAQASAVIDHNTDVNMGDAVDTTQTTLTQESAPDTLMSDAPPSAAQDATDTQDAPESNGASSTEPIKSEEGATASSEAAPPKISRERDEDDNTEEPSAKRPKTEDASGDLSSAATQASEPAVKPETDGESMPAESKLSSSAAPISTEGATEAPASTAGPTAVVPPPGTPSFDSAPMTESQRKRLAEGLRNIKKSKSAQPFLKPVDIVALNIPNYPTIVKTPMDLSTIETKLKENKYESVDAYTADWDLMVNNSIIFNGQQHLVSQNGMQARSQMQAQLRRIPRAGDPVAPEPPKKQKSPAVANPVREVRRQSMPKPEAPPTPAPAQSPSTETYAAPNGVPTIRRGSSTNLHRPKREIHKPTRELAYQHTKPVKKKYKAEIDFCKHVLDEMTRPRYSALLLPFEKPVDPVALAIPTYFKVVKKPMDISTIRDKLSKGQYQSMKEFEADLKLIWANCLRFNGEGHPLVNTAREYERMFEEEFRKKDEWIAQHAPESVPQSPVEETEEEEEEEDEEEESNPANELIALQQQMQELQQKTAELLAKQSKASTKKGGAGKKGAKTAKAAPAKKRKSSGPAGGRAEKVSKPKKPLRAVSTNEKMEISEKIAHLNPEQIGKAADIIKTGLRRAGHHELANKAEDEMEFDIETIPNDSLHELLKLVRKSLQSTDDDDARRAAAASARSKKNKPMNKAEQANQIARLEGQLAHFDGPGSPPDEGEEDEDDDESSGSESEEE